jgi:dTDP-4-dehydrorhamnose 3,5-epimerase
MQEVKLIEMPRFGDARGFFAETYNQRAFSQAGIEIAFVQDNHSASAARGTLRGLHFQVHPFAQDKLVRVGRGRILDVVVDIRHGSPTFGRHVSAILSADQEKQILVPVGFAHGIVTLEDDTEIIYKVSNFYSAEHDKGILWNDPALGIDWGLDDIEPLLSEKDRHHPLLADLPRYFEYDREPAGKCPA